MKKINSNEIGIVMNSLQYPWSNPALSAAIQIKLSYLIDNLLPNGDWSNSG